MQSDWSRVFSVTTQELDFSQPCRFCRLSKGGASFKTKNLLDGLNVLSKI